MTEPAVRPSTRYFFLLEGGKMQPVDLMRSEPEAVERALAAMAVTLA